MKKNKKPVPLKALEKKHIKEALKFHKGCKVRAAESLKISRRSLYYKIYEHELDREFIR